MPRKLLSLCLLLFLVPGISFADVSTQDHNTNPALWNGLPSYDCIDDGVGGIGTSGDAVTASEFLGNGGKINKVSGIFENSIVSNNNWVPNPNPWWNDFTYDIIFYPDSAAFVADPFATSGNHGITKINLPAPTNITHPFHVGYSQGYKQHRLEFDISAFNIQTTTNATHLIAILPKSKLGGMFSGGTYLLASTGNGGSVGTGQGWHRNNYLTGMGPASLQSLNAPFNYVSLKVVLDDPSMPFFSIDVNHVATTLSVQNANLGGLDILNFSYQIGNLEVWSFALQLIYTANPLLFLNVTAADSFDLYLFADFYGLPQRFGGCTSGQNPVCHYTP